jgi:PKD repeat protein
VSHRTSCLRPRSSSALLFFIALAFSTIRPHAQSSPQLAWDEDAASIVTGFAVIIDGVRTDYGLSPQRSDGTCNCSVPLPFSSGRHTIVVSAYNSDGEAASDPLTVGPTAQAGGPYSGQQAMPVSVTAAGSTDVTGTITSYVWNWGDGTQDDTSANDTASHIYQSGGIFTITLTVTDDFAAIDTDTTTAAIAVPLPPAVPSNPNPSDGAIAIGLSPTLAWSAGAPGTSYDVFFGRTNPPPQVSTAQAAALYTPAPLADTTPYFWRIVAHNAAGATSGPIWSFTTMGPAVTAVPGTIQAEDFDEGGESVAYHDTTLGNSLGQYRATDVDIEATTDTGGGFNLGKTRAGEWLKYTVNVAATGTYVLDTRVANIGTGAMFHVEVDGVNRSGPIAVPDTGGWQTWQTVTTAGIPLAAGLHVIRVALDTVASAGGAGNFNWFRFAAGYEGTPFGATPAPLPGIVQAENFDNGGEGVAYHDASAGNSGNVYRTTDVDLGPTADLLSGGSYLGWTREGEWLKYSVNATEARTYALHVRVANVGSGAMFGIEVDGVDATGPVAVPETGGWDVWQTISLSGITLSQGPHVIRLVMLTRNAQNSGVGNFGYFLFE